MTAQCASVCLPNRAVVSHLLCSRFEMTSVSIKRLLGLIRQNRAERWAGSVGVLCNLTADRKHESKGWLTEHQKKINIRILHGQDSNTFLFLTIVRALGTTARRSHLIYRNTFYTCSELLFSLSVHLFVIFSINWFVFCSICQKILINGFPAT